MCSQTHRLPLERRTETPSAPRSPIVSPCLLEQKTDWSPACASNFDGTTDFRAAMSKASKTQVYAAEDQPRWIAALAKKLTRIVPNDLVELHSKVPVNKRVGRCMCVGLCRCTAVCLCVLRFGCQGGARGKGGLGTLAVAGYHGDSMSFVCLPGAVRDSSGGFQHLRHGVLRVPGALHVCVQCQDCGVQDRYQCR